MNNEKAYDEMTRVAIEKSYPKIYENDLIIHDKAYLRGSEDGIHFGWVLRECGTNMLHPATLTLEALKAQDKLFGSHAHYYWWDGKELLEMSVEALAGKMVPE